MLLTQNVERICPVGAASESRLPSGGMARCRSHRMLTAPAVPRNENCWGVLGMFDIANAYTIEWHRL